MSKVSPDGSETPHRAFGAYRLAFQRMRESYDVFVFISDQVVLRRTGWLAPLIRALAVHDGIGFAGTQIYNGHDAGPMRTRYPHPSHVNAPGPIAVKTAHLARIDWDIRSDHHGEMTFGAKLVAAGSVGVQAGNKLNLGFDTLGTPPLVSKGKQRSNYLQISQLLEARYFPSKKGIAPFADGEHDFFEQLHDSLTEAERNATTIRSPFRHIGVQNVFFDLQPFNMLIYGPSLPLAQRLGLPVVQRARNAYCVRP